MLLTLSVDSGSCRVDWSGYALLRDNVQHFIEGGEPSARFEALHAIEQAVDEGGAVVDASRLRGEVLRAWCVLSRLSIDDAAVSVRTRAITTGIPERTTSGTILAKRVGWALPVPESGSGDVTKHATQFIGSVLALTENVVDGDTIEVRREGASPAVGGADADPRD